MTSRQGRVRLDRIAAEWAEESVINPPMLASELAAVLRSVSPENQPIHEAYVSALLSGNPSGAGAITFGALAAYFDEVGQSKAPQTIATLSGCVPASVVTVARVWIGRLATDAAERAAFAAGYVVPANDCPSAAMVSNASPVASSADQPLPPSGSEPVYLKMREAQQRREGESSAAEQLDAERIARQRAELLANAKDAQLQKALDEIEQLRRELSDTHRAKQKVEDYVIGMEEQLEAVMVFAECLRPDNPISPPELRIAVECWRYITKDGIHNPAAPGGRGIHGLVDEWIAIKGLDLKPEQAARLRAIVSWRKRGSGAIRTR